MDRVIEILETLLHVEVSRKTSLSVKKMPLFLRNAYEMEQLTVEGLEILFVRPRENKSFAALKREWLQISETSALTCVLYLDESSRYGREKMIEIGMPFILGEENVYLPFLGIALRKKRLARLPQIKKFTPAAQKMILTAIYEQWREKSCKEISEQMQISRMTASRNLLELEALQLPLTQTRGSAKYFVYDGSKRQLFEMCSPYFDMPAAKNILLEEIPKGADCLGGRSALSRYSALADHSYLTYAMTREEYRDLHIADYPECEYEEDAACMIQIVRYKIKMGKQIDPLSALMCETEGKKAGLREETQMRRILDKALKESDAE